MDFTISQFNQLLKSFINAGYSFQTFREFIENPKSRVCILRHDVDRLPGNSLETSLIEYQLGICGSYYFRIVQESFNEEIIKKVYSLGHEVGYHYEDLSFAWAKLKAKGSGHRAQGEEFEKELAQTGIELFKNNLGKFRRIVPVKTICMHGSPMSKWDSRLLWKYYDYHDFGLTADPYFDLNFEEMLYLTDTGRRWDGGSVSIRDKGLDIRDEANVYKEWKVKPIKGSLMNMSQKSIDFQNSYKFKSTSDIIRAAERVELPDKMMMTFHPQRWTDKPGPWLKELVLQNVKNVGKYFLIKLRS